MCARACVCVCVRVRACMHACFLYPSDMCAVVCVSVHVCVLRIHTLCVYLCARARVCVYMCWFFFITLDSMGHAMPFSEFNLISEFKQKE